VKDSVNTEKDIQINLTTSYFHSGRGWMAWKNLGGVLLQKGELDEAIAHLLLSDRNQNPTMPIPRIISALSSSKKDN
jgi:hypothetical protein